MIQPFSLEYIRLYLIDSIEFLWHEIHEPWSHY